MVVERVQQSLLRWRSTGSRTVNIYNNNVCRLWTLPFSLDNNNKVAYWRRMPFEETQPSFNTELEKKKSTLLTDWLYVRVCNTFHQLWRISYTVTRQIEAPASIKTSCFCLMFYGIIQFSKCQNDWHMNVADCQWKKKHCWQLRATDGNNGSTDGNIYIFTRKTKQNNYIQNALPTNCRVCCDNRQILLKLTWDSKIRKKNKKAIMRKRGLTSIVNKMSDQTVFIILGAICM